MELITDKCNRCGSFSLYHNIYTSRNSYPICHKCLDEWLSDGYSDIWYTFYDANNHDLADKFILDFLGKLGEQDVI